jgi:tRNA A37 threonylcarbamoyltransferase TsaD
MANSQLLQVIDELIAQSRSASEPDVTEVLAALGYVVALQNAPEVGGVVPASLSRNVLESLVVVVKDWLIQKNARASENSVAGFYQRAGEHVLRLRTPSTER